MRVEIPEDDEKEFTQRPKEKGLHYTAATSRQMTGEALAVSVMLSVNAKAR